MGNSTLFQKLEQILAGQNRPENDLAEIKNAFELAEEYHRGQYRASEEPYIAHPLEVACILADLQSDKETLIAALLHDLLEDTDATEETISERYGEVVLNLVNGVTKLGKFSFSSREQRQAENFRKMFLAMADDVRVILLKLADRLHNMRTLNHMTSAKQKEIAQETLEIFSPLANRMGMGKLKFELDDLSLSYLHPDKYLEIAQFLSQSRRDREENVKNSIEKIKAFLKESSIEGAVHGRVKNHYSIYNKINRGKTFEELYDISAVRILTRTEKECYEVLGIIHAAFKPIPGRFKDYIAMPKSNLYRSLHTTVIGPNGKPLEVQIRTFEMHHVAEYGIAAHWKYKEVGSKSASEEIDRKFAWLRKLVEFQQDVNDAKEYVDSVKLDLFRDEVFVFTPKGDVIDLPSGAVPIDFAYRIHTEVGHTCVGALVNSKMVTIDTLLRSGDIVEIITNKNSHPRLDWLNLVATNTAKSRIRSWFKKNRREEHIAQGKTLLDSELTKQKADEIIKSGKLEEIANQLNYHTIDDLFAAIGYGEINTLKITNRLKRDEKPVEELVSKPRFAAGKDKKTLKQIEGLDNMLYRISKCCFPLPGENIVGVVTRSRGVSIHREDCKALSKVAPERIMNITWSEKSQLSKAKSYPVSFVIEVIDRIGVFKDILGKIADSNINVTYAGVKTRHDNTALVEISVEVPGKNHYDSLINSLYDISDVINVKRQQVGTSIRMAKNNKKAGKSKGKKNKKT
jgi:RelA/SpoT family (p)ppGpp synthetase